MRDGNEPHEDMPTKVWVSYNQEIDDGTYDVIVNGVVIESLTLVETSSGYLWIDASDDKTPLTERVDQINEIIRVGSLFESWSDAMGWLIDAMIDKHGTGLEQSP